MSGDELIAALQRLSPEQRKMQVVFERLEIADPRARNATPRGDLADLVDVTSTIDSLGVARSATSGQQVIHLFARGER